MCVVAISLHRVTRIESEYYTVSPDAGAPFPVLSLTFYDEDGKETTVKVFPETEGATDAKKIGTALS